MRFRRGQLVDWVDAVHGHGGRADDESTRMDADLVTDFSRFHDLGRDFAARSTQRSNLPLSRAGVVARFVVKLLTI